jgi:hypothetical protein
MITTEFARRLCVTVLVSLSLLAMASSSAAWADCPTNTIPVGDRVEMNTNGDRVHHLQCMQLPTIPADRNVVLGLLAEAKRNHWDDKKQQRLALAMLSLGLPSNFNPASYDVDGAWAAVMARGQNAELAREAAQAPGPELFSAGAGQQSFNDCTLFALANATGQPYDVVAARADLLLRHASWRPDADRANPPQVFERPAIQNAGLNAGEVIFLAENYGQAEMITPANFAQTLRSGVPITIAVQLPNPPPPPALPIDHQVVLSKSFQHGGQTWYEMMDSNQGATQRLYWSAAEIDTVIAENGVAIHRNPGTTPQLLH